MAQYKLTYFNGVGLAESIRLLFVYGGIPFEDDRIEVENWPKLKSSMPFGQVPLLEDKKTGKKVNQSLAINRFVAKLVKLAGNNDWEDLEIDAVADTINDLRIKIMGVIQEKDAALKATKEETLFKETIPYYLERLDKIAKENKGHLAAGRLTWADFYLTCILYPWEKFLKKDIIANYPNLVAIRNNVNNIPSVKKWIEARPDTPF